MSPIRTISRLLFYAAVALIGLDAVLLGILMLPPSFAPDFPKGTNDGMALVAAWVGGFSLLVWLVTRRDAYPTVGATTAYAAAIPPHLDGVDMLAARPGEGARRQAAVLLASPHTSAEHRERVVREAANWTAGAEAEEKAGRLLAALGSDWTVLHDITVHHRGWNLDHVAIGPQGIFVINTKTTTAPQVTVDGDTLQVGTWTKDYIPQSRTEAYRTHVALLGTARRVAVTPVLLFINTKQVTVINPPEDVLIVQEHDLVDALTAGPVRLSPRKYGFLVAKARYQETWLTGWETAQRLTRSGPRPQGH